jgi:hypothetical protein
VSQVYATEALIEPSDYSIVGLNSVFNLPVVTEVRLKQCLITATEREASIVVANS